MASNGDPLVRLQVKCEEGMIDSLNAYALEHETSVSDVVRHAIADRIGYSMGEPVERRGRKPKYNNDDERREAARERSARERDIQRELLQDYRREERQGVVKRMQESLNHDPE